MLLVCQAERTELAGVKEAQKELEAARHEAELAQRRGDFVRAGELVHAVIPVSGRSHVALGGGRAAHDGDAHLCVCEPV